MATEVYTVIGVLLTMWVGWISLTTWQNTVKINSLMQIKDIVNGISTRLDIFIKNELDTLKEIAEKK